MLIAGVTEYDNDTTRNNVNDYLYRSIRSGQFLANEDERKLIAISTGTADGTIEEQISLAREILTKSKMVDVSNYIRFAGDCKHSLAVCLITGAREFEGKGIAYHLALEVIPYCSLEMLEAMIFYVEDFFEPNLGSSNTALHGDIFLEMHDAYYAKKYPNNPEAYLDSFITDYEPKAKIARPTDALSPEAKEVLLYSFGLGAKARKEWEEARAESDRQPDTFSDGLIKARK